MSHRSPILASTAAVAAFSLLAAGCGGGGSPGVASVASSTVTTASATPNVSTAPDGTVASALAFARCMRSHGIPNWPDPTSRGVFDKAELQQLGVSTTRIRALEAGACNIPLPSAGQPQEQTITPAEQADYRGAAACMRSRGVPAFPDPTFQHNSVTFDIPSSIDTNSSRFESARATCEKLIPAGLPDSSSGGA